MSRRTKHYFLALLPILFSCSFVSAQNGKKVSYGILVDNTGSMRSQFNQVTALGKSVVKHVYQNGPVSIFHFSSQGDRRNPIAMATSGIESQDPDALETYIDYLYVLAGQTTLLDAIGSMAKELTARNSADKGRETSPVVIVISDGEDRVSHLKEKDLINELKASGTRVYALGLVQELSGSKRDKAKDLLRNVTSETGGRVVFSDSRISDVDKLVTELLTPPTQK
ncbi:MAG: vWA domain-containing protein [Pyrinomonadaceae bacterium]